MIGQFLAAYDLTTLLQL